MTTQPDTQPMHGVTLVDAPEGYARHAANRMRTYQSQLGDTLTVTTLVHRTGGDTVTIYMADLDGNLGFGTNPGAATTEAYRMREVRHTLQRGL